MKSFPDYENLYNWGDWKQCASLHREPLYSRAGYLCASQYKQMVSAFHESNNLIFGKDFRERAGK